MAWVVSATLDRALGYLAPGVLKALMTLSVMSFLGLTYTAS